jgi:integrase
MKGSVTKYIVHGSSRPKWRYRLRLGNDENGRSIREGRGGFAKEGEARDTMRARIEEIIRQRNAPETPPKPTETTLREWLARWISTYAVQTCEPKTIERYAQLIDYITKGKNVELTAVAATPISTLKHGPLESALFALMREPGKRREHISAHTVGHVAGVLQVALGEALRLDLIAVNPMLKVRRPKVERVEARALTQVEIQSVRDVCRGDWTLTFVDIALASGARRGELLSVEWPDIDWLSGTVIISKSLEQTAAGLRVKRPKSDRVRKFRLGPTAIASLLFLREQQQEYRRLYGTDYKGELIFCEPDGSHLDPALVSQTIARRIKKADIKNASLHTLRHTLASHLLSNGVPVPVVSKMLGHADSAVTLRIYAHMVPDDDGRAADTWERLIADPVPAGLPEHAESVQ